MKLPLLSAACFLALASVAQADQPFPTFLNGQGAAAPLTAPNQIPVIQGGVTTKASPTDINTYIQAQFPNAIVLHPAAGGADNAPQLTAAFATGVGAQVILTPGYYMVCSQVDMAGPQRHLFALGTTASMDNNQPGYPVLAPTAIGSSGCPSGGNGTFAADQGYLKAHDKNIIEGFAIQGQRQIGGHVNINCINGRNAIGLIVQNMVITDCYLGIDRRSSATGGDSAQIANDAFIRNNIFWYVEQNGILCGTFDGGNGCADEHYHDNEFEVPFNGPGIVCSGCANSQFLNNRFEDGGTGIQLTGGNDLIITGNFHNRLVMLVIDGASTGVLYSNNRGSGVEPGNVESAVYMSAQCSYCVFNNNLFAYYYISTFEITGAGGFTDSTVTGNVFRTGFASSNAENGKIFGSIPNVPSRGYTLGNNDPAFLGWTASAATLATSAVRSPVGLQMAARLTEDNTTAAHTMFAPTVSLDTGTTYTSMVYFQPGTSGTRNAAIRLNDGTNSIQLIVNPSTCATVGSSVTGAATSLGVPGAISVGNGWCRAAVSFTGIGATTPVVALFSGSTSSYAGDNTSNLNFYGFNTYFGSGVAPNAVSLME